MSTEIVYHGRDAGGVHNFQIGAVQVSASKTTGWSCSACGPGECDHVTAAKADYRARREASHAPSPTGPPQESEAKTAPAPAPAAPGQNGHGAAANKAASPMLTELRRIAAALEALVSAEPRRPGAEHSAEAPADLEYPLADYAGFDWAGIGAQVVARDNGGATVVRHGGVIYKRRSPDNRFGEAIWFSRPAGRDADGAMQYRRLITFRKLTEVDPLPAKVAAKL